MNLTGLALDGILAIGIPILLLFTYGVIFSFVQLIRGLWRRKNAIDNLVVFSSGMESALINVEEISSMRVMGIGNHDTNEKIYIEITLTNGAQQPHYITLNTKSRPEGFKAIQEFRESLK